MLNRVVIVGNLTRDPELRYVPSGTARATFGIAVNDYRKGEDGKPLAHFFNVVAWDKQGEFCATYLTKGCRVGIDGRLQYRSWTNDVGEKRSAVEIVAERIDNLTPRPQEGTGQPSTGSPYDWGGNTPDAGPIDDDRDPFADD
jgi:single-strand DNA-binding protein